MCGSLGDIGRSALTIAWPASTTTEAPHYEVLSLFPFGLQVERSYHQTAGGGRSPTHGPSVEGFATDSPESSDPLIGVAPGVLRHLRQAGCSLSTARPAATYSRTGPLACTSGAVRIVASGDSVPHPSSTRLTDCLRICPGCLPVRRLRHFRGTSPPGRPMLYRANLPRPAYGIKRVEDLPKCSVLQFDDVLVCERALIRLWAIHISFTPGAVCSGRRELGAEGRNAGRRAEQRTNPDYMQIWVQVPKTTHCGIAAHRERDGCSGPVRTAFGPNGAIRE